MIPHKELLWIVPVLRTKQTPPNLVSRSQTLAGLRETTPNQPTTTIQTEDLLHSY